MPKCKFNKKLQCLKSECTPKCDEFKATGQQMFEAPQPQVIETKKRKGHTVEYYKVKK